MLQLRGYTLHGHEFNKIHSVTSQASVDIVERDIVYIVKALLARPGLRK